MTKTLSVNSPLLTFRFEIDETSPSMSGCCGDDCSYEILSRRTKHGEASAGHTHGGGHCGGCCHWIHSCSWYLIGLKKKKASNFHGCVWKLELPANSANAMSLNDHVCGFNEWSVEFRAADVDVLRNETCMFLGVFLLQKQYQCGLSHIVTCLWFPTAWFNVRHFSLILMISSNSPFRKKLLADIINDQSQPHSTSLSSANVLYCIEFICNCCFIQSSKFVGSWTLCSIFDTDCTHILLFLKKSTAATALIETKLISDTTITSMQYIISITSPVRVWWLVSKAPQMSLFIFSSFCLQIDYALHLTHYGWV